MPTTKGLLTVTILSLFGSILPTKIFKIHHISSSCPDHKDVIAYFTNLRTSTINKAQYLSGKLIVKRDIGFSEEDLWLKIKGERCTTKEAPDTCEPFKELHFKSACDTAQAKHQFWSPLMENIHPPVICPIKKGTYDLVNGSFDVNSMMGMAFSSMYWKLHTLVYERDTTGAASVALCLQFEGRAIDI